MEATVQEQFSTDRAVVESTAQSKSPIEEYEVIYEKNHIIVGYFCPSCDTDISREYGDSCLSCGWVSSSTLKYREKKRISEQAHVIGRELWRAYGHCFYCGASHEESWRPGIDHIHPKNLGGGNEDGNLVPCCGKCNSTKAKSDLETFRERIRKRLYDVITPEIYWWYESLGFTPPNYKDAPQVTFKFEAESGGWTW